MKTILQLIFLTVVIGITPYYSQTITLYEFGVGTNESIDDFTSSFAGNVTSYDFTANGNALSITDSIDDGEGIVYLMKKLPDMSLYSNLIFYVEYTSSDFNNELSLLVDTSLNAAYNSSNLLLSPPSGTIVANNPQSMTDVSYLSSVSDSVFKLRMLFPDSGSFSIDYIRISADQSSSVQEEVYNEIDIFGIGKSIKVDDNSVEPYEIRVYDLSGKVIYCINGIGQNSYFPNVKSGIYLVEISTLSSHKYKKIFLE